MCFVSPFIKLELLTEQQQQNPAIVFCTQLDRHLMVGSYDQVLQAAAHPPVPYYSFFLTSLLETVRMNIGECVAASYKKLTLSAAKEILMFSTNEETLEFISVNYPSWSIGGGGGDEIDLQEQKGSRSEGIPSVKLISQTLAYATELERIV